MAKEQVIELEFEIDKKSAKKLQKQFTNGIERATVGTVERLLIRVEDATLIKKYTQTSNPHKPEGSKYIRTFRLQRSSERQITHRALPVTGEWRAKAKYASSVIGMAADQAPIHAGRWPSLELAINTVNKNAQDDFDKEVARLTRGK